MRVSVCALAGWVLTAGAAAGLAGAYPTWLLRGPSGLLAQAVAGGTALGAVMLSACFVAGAAFEGAARAVLTFMATAAVRVFFSAAVGLFAVWRMDLCGRTYLVWLALFYAAMLVVEVAWLVRAMAADRQRAILDEIDRSGRDPWAGI